MHCSDEVQAGEVELVCSADMARILGVCRKTLKKMVDSGMPHLVVGSRRRFVVEEALAWIRRER
jgi:hypothetical protein